MARLVPKVDLDAIAVKPERDVARALVAGLGNDCVVYHSHPWLRLERGDRGRREVLQEGETDFVVVDPARGLLVLEVKGGDIDHDPEARVWYRRLGDGARRRITDPFEQARRNLHALERQILAHGFEGRRPSLPFAYGYAVVFPDCEYRGPAPPGADPAIILSAPDLAHLGSRLAAVLRKWSRADPPRRLGEDDLQAIARGLTPAFRLLPLLFRRIEEQEEHLVRLTTEQQRLLEFLGGRERAAIRGVAGSGKTLLAGAQAERFADRGMRTLFVCFNKALAEWLQDALPASYRERITVRHFHALCHDLCQAASIPFAPSAAGGDGFWRYQAPNLLERAIAATGTRFDAVVVDEGQDFYPEWWVPLELVNAREDQGALYVFYDPAQNLFVGEDGTLPELGAPFELPTNCRNTRAIASLCGRIRGIDIATRPDAPEGIECRLEVAPTARDQLDGARAVLGEWIGKGRLRPSQVAVLGPRQRSRSSLGSIDRLGNVPIVDSLAAWAAGDGCLYATIRAFKGLEADAVLMIDVPAPDSAPYFSTADFYVGASRAKHVLTVLANAQDVLG